MRRALAILALATLCVSGIPAQDRTSDRLAPTAHPPLPAQRSHYWLIPEAALAPSATPRDASVERLARGVTLIAAGDFAGGLPLVSPGDLDGTRLGPYARYYTALAQIGLARLDAADATLKALAPSKLEGALRETATLMLADVAVKRGDADRAEDLLENLADDKLGRPEDVLIALGRAEEALTHVDHALQAYRRVYYDYPLSSQATEAADAIARVETVSLIAPDKYQREMSRAQRLFDARRWAQARAAFEPLSRAATSADDRDLIALRMAECAYNLERHSESRKLLQPLLTGGRREAEARYFHLAATRGAGDSTTYIKLARGLVADHPESDWAAETLNNLASYYIVADRDAEADAVFRELLKRFPRHRYSERAAWKSGWTAYRLDNFREAAELFDAGAAAFARSDYRPSWLYWSGRAHDQLGSAETANARYRLTVADYQNSYYGRLASKLLAARRQPSSPPSTTAATPVPPSAVPTDQLIRALTAAQLYDDALKEVQYAQKVWGDSPQLQATVAWIRHRQGQTLKAQERFDALRGAITTMRRAYPQFLAAGGENVPPEVMRIIFPLDYWPLITKYSSAHDLDPYLIAALMAQESTFTPEIRSAANAYGLMQIIPATGRTLARQLGLRYTTAMLTQPETNVRMGTKYFKDLLDRFGGAHYALAGYNAGPHRVVTWQKEAPGLEQDEFIDNIPFTETQAYVKRILGTAEDYRRLYGPSRR